jgi:hypothetical protein
MRFAGTIGRALLFLIPSEIGFLKYLKAAKVHWSSSTLLAFFRRANSLLHKSYLPLIGVKVSLNEYEFPQSKVSNVQSQVDTPSTRNMCVLADLIWNRPILV